MAARFHSELFVRTYRSDKWKLTRDFTYTTALFGEDVDITCRKGFISDLASIPKWARSLIAQNGRHRRAAVIHDWLYGDESNHNYTRLQCDRIFLEGMIAAEVPLWKRSVMYRAVRISLKAKGIYEKNNSV